MIKSINKNSRGIMAEVGDVLEIEIESLTYGGNGLGFYNRQAVFVLRGLPQDKLRARVIGVKKNYLLAAAEEVIESSPFRTGSQCTAFEVGCGGCQWLHLQYDQQLLWKKKILKEVVKRIGKLDLDVPPLLPEDPPYQYRNKMSLHFSRHQKPGFYKEKSNQVIEFHQCLQQKVLNQQVYEYFKNRVIPTSITQIDMRSSILEKCAICILTNKKDHKIAPFIKELAECFPQLTGAGVSTKRGYHVVHGEPFLKIEMDRTGYQVPHNGFFQTNYHQAEEMLRIVREFAELKSQDVLLDLYCGVGFFALDLAREVKYICGIESSRDAVACARVNAKLNQINNAEFFTADVAEGVLKYNNQRFDTIVLDPPRQGCEKKVLDHMVQLSPDVIVYVSCAPDTLARDLKILTQAKYQISRCQALDMFPHTYHVETIVQLKR
jgi:23S rRNA (uracil1939-C5)-methyltransferase